MPQLAAAATATFAAFQAGATALLTANTLGATVAKFALSAALSIGTQAYQRSKLKKSGVAVAANDSQATQQLYQQADAPQQLILGRATTSGALLWGEGGRPYLTMLIELAAHETDGLESVFINGTDIRIGPDGFATSTPFRDGDNKYIEVSFRNGHIDQEIDPIIAREFPEIEQEFRQRGKTTVCIRAHYGYGAGETGRQDHERVFGIGAFNPLFRIRGAKVFDPRSPYQVVNDPSTWTWSDNGALCLTHLLRFRWPDMRLLEDRQIDFDKVAIAAEEADRWNLTKSGKKIRNATINGVVRSIDSPAGAIRAMEDAIDGYLSMTSAKIYPVIESVGEPVATLHEGMLIGGVEFQAQQPARQSPNIVRTEFVAPDRAYKKVDGPVLRDEAAIALDGRTNEIKLDLGFVEGHEQAQRIAQRTLRRERLDKALACGAALEARDWQPGDIIRVAFQRDALVPMNGLYRLVSREHDEGLNSFRIALREYSDNVYRFNPQTDEQDFTAGAEAA